MSRRTLTRTALATVCTAVIVLAVSLGDAEAIVGGRPASAEYPFIASLQTSTGKHECGGAVITPEWVLTAAHCVIQFGGNTDVEQVRVGSPNRVSGGEVHQVAERFPHPEFETKGGPLGDIALLRLHTPTTVAPIALGSTAPIGSRLRLLGWGLDCANPNGCGRELPRILNEVDVTAVGAESCAPGRGEPGTEICHDNPGGADACTFDSGGPALIGSPGNWAVVGTASRDGAGPNCGDGAGIYTDATAYRVWIRATMASRPAA